MSGSKQQSGAVYKIKRKHLGQLKIFADLECLSDLERNFLMSLLELSVHLAQQKEYLDSDVILVYRSELQEWLKEKGMASGPTVIKKRSASLTDLGVFTLDVFQIPKRRPSNLHILQDATDIITIKAPVVRKFEDHRKHRKNLRDEDEQLALMDIQVLNDINFPLARSERLWNGVFGSCMRASRLDPRRYDPITSIYKFGSEKITIVTSAQSDSTICHVDDQRTIRAIMSMVCIKINKLAIEKVQIQNNFAIDIVKLLKLMGYDDGGGNRDTIRDSLHRLYSTNFNIKLNPDGEETKKFVKQFGIIPADDLNFRFLTELDSSIDKNENTRRPRRFRIALHSKTFQDLMDPKVISTFIDNKNILKVSNGLIHLLYSWCSINVKRSGQRVIETPLPRLQQQLVPAARYDNFKNRFIMALKGYLARDGQVFMPTELNEINLFGYYIQIRPDATYDFTVKAWRDKSDAIVGDNSTHNKIIGSQSANPQPDLLESANID